MTKPRAMFVLIPMVAVTGCDYHNPKDAKKIAELQRQLKTLSDEVKATSLEAKQQAGHAAYLQSVVDHDLSGGELTESMQIEPTDIDSKAEDKAFVQRMHNRVEADPRLAADAAESSASR